MDLLGAPANGSENYLSAKHLPKLSYADPQPILAKAGQISVVTTATIHSASVNTGQTPRLVLFTIWKPRGFHVPFNMTDAARREEHYQAMREVFRPDRRHLVPAPANV
jgi:hypothetical protein